MYEKDRGLHSVGSKGSPSLWKHAGCTVRATVKVTRKMREMKMPRTMGMATTNLLTWRLKCDRLVLVPFVSVFVVFVVEAFVFVVAFVMVVVAVVVSP